MMNRRGMYRQALALLVCAALILINCSKSQENKTSSPILIGVVLSLSGERLAYGQDCLQGIEMAIDIANVMGGVKGRRIELVVEDDNSSTVKSIQAVQKLVSDKRIIGIIGGTSSKLAMADASVAQELNIPFVTPLATNPNVTKTGSFISRICFVDTYQGSVLAEYSYRFLKLKTMGIIFNPDDEYSLGLATYLKKRYLKLGGKIVFEIFQTTPHLDSSLIVNHLRDKKPDAIFMPGYHVLAAELVNLVKRNGLDLAMLGGDGWESSEFNQATSDILTENDRVFITTHFSPDNAQPLVNRFVTDYKSRTGKLPVASSALGYDAAGVVCEALRRTPQLSRRALSESINSISDYDGVTGTITFNEKRDPIKDVVILRSYGGKFFFEATLNLR